jgi:hypothetical protein
MNPYVTAVLVVLGAILVPMGAGMSAGIHDWYVLGGGMATAGASALAGLFVRLPQKEWSEAERAAKLGDKA